MKLKGVEKKENNKVELSILVEKEEFEQSCERSYKKNVHKINIQGFRRGKAPRKMIEKLYGKEMFYEDAMDDCYWDAYLFAVKEAGITPVDRPALTDFDVSDDGEFSFVAVVTVKPEVEVKDYKGISVEKEEAQVTDSELEQELERLRDRNARLVPVQREVQSGDVAVFDFEGFVDGVPFEGGKAENYNLKIGSGMFIPGFEDQMIGKKIEEDFDVSVTFPEDYQSTELAGKAAVFKCKIHELSENVKPELDDEFAKDVSEFDTLEEYKKDLHDKLLKSAEARVNQEYEERLLDKMIEGLSADIPEVMIESQLDRVVEDFGYRLSMQGVPLESYLKMNDMSMENFRLLFREQAERQVKVTLGLEKIAELEQVAVTDEDIDKEMESLAEKNGMEVAKIREFMDREMLKSDLQKQRAMDVIKDSAKPEKAKAKKPAAKKSAAKKDEDKTEKAEKPAKKAAPKAKASEAGEPAGEKKAVPKKRATKKTEEKTEE